MKEARRLLGTREAPGAANSSVIIGWARSIGGWIASFYRQDSIPWCGLFVNHCMSVGGQPTIQDGLGALNWSKYGKKLAIGVPGAILVFKREGGGHVGFYVSEDDTTYHVLGGNQSDAVTIARVAKNRIVAIRWPGNAKLPADLRPVKKKFDGKISTNEA
jgi:uncharacterized protein (TIGR02594 family)